MSAKSNDLRPENVDHYVNHIDTNIAPRDEFDPMTAYINRRVTNVDGTKAWEEYKTKTYGKDKKSK
jgi:hypothetical protein